MSKNLMILVASSIITFIVMSLIGKANLDGYAEGYAKGYKLSESICGQQLQRRDEYIRNREERAGTAAS